MDGPHWTQDMPTDRWYDADDPALPEHVRAELMEIQTRDGIRRSYRSYGLTFAEAEAGAEPVEARPIYRSSSSVADLTEMERRNRESRGRARHRVMHHGTNDPAVCDAEAGRGPCQIVAP